MKMQSHQFDQVEMHQVRQLKDLRGQTKLGLFAAQMAGIPTRKQDDHSQQVVKVEHGLERVGLTVREWVSRHSE
jgi:hypothetical protein